MSRRLWINSLGEVGFRDMNGVLSESEMKTALTEKQQAVVSLVWGIQDAVTDGRFRAYLGKSGPILVTEFIYFSDEKEVAKGIRWLAEELGARVFVMIEHPHLDHVTYDYGTPQAREVFGENHGRMETQVEMVWPVRSVKEALSLKKKAEKVTQSLWNNYGVNVI